MDDNTYEVRRCKRGHIKRPGASICHDCHAQTARERYRNNPAAERKRAAMKYRRDNPDAHLPYTPHPNLQVFALAKASADKRFKKNRPKYVPTVAERQAQRERHKAVDFCPHSNATLIATGNYHCPDCNAHINPFTGDIISEAQAGEAAVQQQQTVPASAEVPAAEAKSKGRKRGPKPKLEKAAEADAVPGAGLQQPVVGQDQAVQPPLPPGALSADAAPSPIPAAPPADAKPRAGRKSSAASGISTPGEITEQHKNPGPWHETLKCPISTCFAKLQHVPDNIVVNGNVTYHYACPNDPGIGVVLQVSKDVIGL